MNQDRVKEILLETADTELEFSVVFTGKSSKKVNGLYKPDTHEIILHNKNFANDNELIYTAVHEYTHHKQCEKEGGFYSTRVHSPKFWTLFHNLLAEAEKKGFYKITLEESPELLELTDEIRQVIMVEDGRLMKELGRLLGKARPLCKKAGVRYEDYVDRVLCLPRASATALEKISAYNVNPEIGYEAMKLVANIGNPEKRAEAEEMFLNKTSPATVRGKISAKKEEDPRRTLEKEKRRLEKTILSLQARLETVESRLANMPISPFIIAVIFSIFTSLPIIAQNSNPIPIPSVPPIPEIPAIPKPNTVSPAIPQAPSAPEFFKIDNQPKNEKVLTKKRLSPAEMIERLNSSQDGAFAKRLMSTLIENDDQGFDVLNKIIEELSKNDVQKFPVQTGSGKNKEGLLIRTFNFNGKNMLGEFGSFAVSYVTPDKSFFLAAESKAAATGQKNGERLYIFAKRNITGTYKLFVEIDQDTKNHNSLFFKFFKNSPFEAKLDQNILLSQIKTDKFDLDAVFDLASN
ncbi:MULTISPECIES: hypothetical protein [unclassified Treponema]|uniref:hypothetical protein n=1 Tax=unclassified Treponema TaxID=2638727 RepID=UPI0020A61200|nr:MULTISPECIES: hypothetical protein [unclassified Treponema]UTC66718.1 hypothetical protein E4O06_12280 [Treponema sp. OMZ 789]UTC69450.1 hypothetical protein E4O01_12420 [Treponema sp. OMZ 790]UTC72164.1 hypothetical protein E4O02_12515 [Treponema sp. OMZ 791]